MKNIRDSYQATQYACFVGYVIQAIVNNFVPLLFLTFESEYGISIQKITLLITINFMVQLCVDLLSAIFTDKIGFRVAAIMAHVLACVGLFCLSVLPSIMPDPYMGIIISVCLYAMGSGLIEVIISPIMESCPTPNKEKAMSILHSFYCWGHAGIVLISTVFFAVFGIENWRYLAIAWSVLSLLNCILFANVPLAPLLPEGQKSMSLYEMARSKVFWLLMLMMMCAGASEQAVSQWASTFAEGALGVSKSMGDLMGPMFFAICMGASRAYFGAGKADNLDRFMKASSVLCIISYLVITLIPVPIVNLLGCGLCGLSVGIMWPGTFSKCAKAMPLGGAAVFSLMALAGDLGCSTGPTLVGVVAGCFDGDLKAGILSGIVFPLLLIVGLVCVGRKETA